MQISFAIPQPFSTQKVNEKTFPDTGSEIRTFSDFFGLCLF